MKFHIITKNETSNGSRHAEFDCKLGRVHQGLARLAEWVELFPDDPNLLFGEAHIRSEYLGQGRRAGVLYQRAYEAHPMARVGFNVVFSRSMAANNAAMFAWNLEEYQSWARHTGDAGQVEGATEQAKAVAMGQPFSSIQMSLAGSREADGHLGDAASLLEIALSGGGIALDEEIRLRRLRAQILRRLDAQADTARNASCEQYPGPERLSLIEAVDEIERALALDEFDAEMWNLKSAWLILLERFAEGLECAEKAISLRPGAYAKPVLNKSQALRGLGRLEESEEYARKAISLAKEIGDQQDAAMATELLEKMRLAERSSPAQLATKWLHAFHRSSLRVGENEAASVHMSVPEMLGGYLRRNAEAGKGWNMAQVQGIAELLTDHTPELCFAIVANIARLDPEKSENIILAILYIASHGEGMLQKDALRLLILYIASVKGLDASRRLFRAGIIVSAVVAREVADDHSQSLFGVRAVAKLDAAILADCSKIQKWLPKVLSDQQPVPTANEKRQTLDSVLFKPLNGDLTARAIRTPRGYVRRLGCALFAVALLSLVAWAAVKVTPWLWRSIEIRTSTQQMPSLWVISLFLVAWFGFFGTIFFRKYAKWKRRHTCAGCGRLAQKLDQPGWMGGSVVITDGMMYGGGREGIGRECPQCDRLYCSNCEEATMYCACGHHPLPMVALSYQQ